MPRDSFLQTLLFPLLQLDLRIIAPNMRPHIASPFGPHNDGGMVSPCASCAYTSEICARYECITRSTKIMMAEKPIWTQH